MKGGGGRLGFLEKSQLLFSLAVYTRTETPFFQFFLSVLLSVFSSVHSVYGRFL